MNDKLKFITCAYVAGILSGINPFCGLIVAWVLIWVVAVGILIGLGRLLRVDKGYVPPTYEVDLSTESFGNPPAFTTATLSDSYNPDFYHTDL